MKLIAIIFSLSIALAGQAPENYDSPKDAFARADFDEGKLHGIVEFSSTKKHQVKVLVDITGLPKEGGPFFYHIHKLPVVDGDCKTTSTHLNPYAAPADCDSVPDDSYCQVGDLSGKHGWINSSCFETSYVDPYLSLNPANKGYPGNLGINLHYSNMTIFACANIVPMSKDNAYHAGEEEKEEATPKKELKKYLSSISPWTKNDSYGNYTCDDEFTIVEENNGVPSYAKGWVGLLALAAMAI